MGYKTLTSEGFFNNKIHKLLLLTDMIPKFYDGPWVVWKINRYNRSQKHPNTIVSLTS